MCDLIPRPGSNLHPCIGSMGILYTRLQRKSQEALVCDISTFIFLFFFSKRRRGKWILVKYSNLVKKYSNSSLVNFLSLTAVHELWLDSNSGFKNGLLLKLWVYTYSPGYFYWFICSQDQLVFCQSYWEKKALIPSSLNLRESGLELLELNCCYYWRVCVQGWCSRGTSRARGWTGRNGVCCRFSPLDRAILEAKTAPKDLSVLWCNKFCLYLS